jgi:hypothetical protein
MEERGGERYTDQHAWRWRILGERNGGHKKEVRVSGWVWRCNGLGFGGICLEVLFIEGLISGILKIVDGQHCFRLHGPLTSKPLKWVEPIYAETTSQGGVPSTTLAT